MKCFCFIKTKNFQNRVETCGNQLADCLRRRPQNSHLSPQHPPVRSRFEKSLKGLGCCPARKSKISHRGASKHCLPSMIYHRRQKCERGALMPCLPHLNSNLTKLPEYLLLQNKHSEILEILLISALTSAKLSVIIRPSAKQRLRYTSLCFPHAVIQVCVLESPLR